MREEQETRSIFALSFETFEEEIFKIGHTHFLETDFDQYLHCGMPRKTNCVFLKNKYI